MYKSVVVNSGRYFLCNHVRVINFMTREISFMNPGKAKNSNGATTKDDPTVIKAKTAELVIVEPFAEAKKRFIQLTTM